MDYLQTSKPTDKFTSRLNGRVLNLRNDFEWRENYMTMEMTEEQVEKIVEHLKQQKNEK